MHEMEDPRRYIRAMNLIRARIQDGTAKPDELITCTSLAALDDHMEQYQLDDRTHQEL